MTIRVPRRLSRADVRLLLAVLVAQVALGGALRAVPMQSLWRAVQRLRITVRRLVPASEERVAWAIEGVGRRLPRISTCLVRALAAELFLGRPDSPGHVRIGVRRSPSGALESHAWFERDGRIIVGGDGAHLYADFATLGTPILDRS